MIIVYYYTLKIIKIRLTSTITNTKLKRRMKITYENDIEINYDDVIDIFCKCLKLNHWLKL